jgi:hypothetical protein
MATEELDLDTVEEPEASPFLGMSDDELMNLDPNTFNQKLSSEPQATEQEEEGEQDEDPETQPQAEGQEAESSGDEDLDEDQEEKVPTPEAGTDEDKPVKGPAPAEKEADKPTEEVDYKAAYERLMAPFKANGKELQVQSVEDAISLMQMGANYNKKMAALKPNLKMLKLLENNGLLNEEKISFLIDVEKKNPAAISKLVKDSGLDPLDMDVTKDSDYQAKTYTVDDRELELDQVLEEIRETPAFNKTIEVISNKFDGKSKQVVADNPQLLKVINDHIERGIYDQISTEVERERMLGRLNGLSDLEAYRQVGDAIQARGGFAQLNAQRQQAPTPQRVAAPAPKAEDPRIVERKRAASPTKAAPSVTAPKADFNPLALSDDEFSKLVNTKLL